MRNLYKYYQDIKITLKNITSKLFTLGIMPFNYSDYNTNTQIWLRII